MAIPLLAHEENLLYSIGRLCSFTLDPVCEGVMTAKRIIQAIVVVVILAASFATTGAALAWSSCASYITVQWGDSWNSIAATCGMTVEALQAANPGVGWWLSMGQVLYIPNAYNPSTPAYGGNTYVIRWGDTLGDIAIRYGVSLSDLLAVNPQIWNADLIFPRQVINLPAFASVPSPTYDPTACNPSPYNPSACNPSTYYPPTYYPTPIVSTQFSNLKITSGPGLLVRAGPGMNFSEIKSPFVSAVKDTEWRYRRDSVTIDSTGLVWVEVALSPMVTGYSTGWIMVRDQLGTHFTDPNIDP